MNRDRNDRNVAKGRNDPVMTLCRVGLVLGLVLFILPPTHGSQPQTPTLVPLPAEIAVAEGSFILRATTTIHAPRSEQEIARLLAGAIARATGLKVSVKTPAETASKTGSIVLALDSARSDLGGEGYLLEVTPKRVSITAAGSTGLFYGVQTFRQLLPSTPAAGKAEYPLDCLKIEDRPRFGWRGFMLDSSRHFVRKATVLNLLDALAMFKINVFHWHLVDDEAWRIAILKYPKLVEPAGITGGDYTQSMGYYSTSDVREIVERARQLQITIVPEIEMPSHARQAASVLPEASCLGVDGKPLPPGATREICLGSDKAIVALQDVLLEVMKMFPHSPYIHLGGDEAEDIHWKACSRCQARMKDLGISDARLLQKWFMKKMNQFVRDQGRTSIAWADRLSLGIPEGQVVHGWHAGELEEAVAKGFRAVQSQHDYTYFDYGQGPGDSAFGGGSLTIERVYALDPVRGLTTEQAKLVLGTQAQLWTSLVKDEQVFAKTFPRILALAEVAWSPQQRRDPEEFSARLKAFMPRLEALGIPSYKLPVVIGKWVPEEMSESWKDLSWDITAQLTKPGTLQAEMRYERGLHAARTEWMAVLEDGREIARDEHTALAGAAHENNLYSLRVPVIKQGATYILRARMKGEGGTDSHGAIFLR